METKKNGGNIPELKDPRAKYVAVGCGKCIECMKQKKRNWQIRLLEDIKEHKNGQFITLTFSEQSLSELNKLIIQSRNEYINSNNIATLAVRRFLERWRKKYKKSLRHWLVTELGQNSTERIHLHGIIFTDEDKETIDNIWQYGMTWVGSFVNEKTINYITKYINKQDLTHKNYIPKILCSPGIGANYLKSYNASLNQFRDYDTKEYYRTSTGHKIGLPTYYRNKLYNDEEREKLWMNRLDEETRYVLGHKIDVSESEDEYNKSLEYYRRYNKELGFGDDSKNWDAIQYRNKLKRIKMKTEELKNKKIKA